MSRGTSALCGGLAQPPLVQDGSLVVMAPPPATTLIHFPILAGRWLSADDGDAVVLNHSALAQGRSRVAAIGQRVWLSLDGQRESFRVVGVVEEIGAAGVAYVSGKTFARLTGTDGRARLLRAVTDSQSPAAREATIRRLESELSLAGVNVDGVTPLTELRTAMGDHIEILIRALLAMALLMAIVGTLGLASTMGISVTERTREFAVMKALGATGARVSRVIIAEAVAVAGASWLFAFAASVPLSLGVDSLVGQLGFLAPLPLVVSIPAACTWLALLGVVSILATSLPARCVARLTVREGLATI